MAMHFDEEDGEVMNEINMTPLVDVMLVLLIIFIITAPVLRHAVKVDLPQASQQPLQAKPLEVVLAVQANGQYLIDEQPIAADELEQRLHAMLPRNPEQKAQLQIQGDKAVPYEHVARAMAKAQLAGWQNLAFVTEREVTRP
jgi:biopolymer transport protein ExbD